MKTGGNFPRFFVGGESRLRHLEWVLFIQFFIPLILFSAKSEITYDFEFLGMPSGSENVIFFRDGEKEIITGVTKIRIKFKESELKIDYVSTGVFKGSEFERYELLIQGDGTPVQLEVSKITDGYKLIFKKGKTHKISKVETSDSFPILDNNIVWLWSKMVEYFLGSSRKSVKIILPQLMVKMKEPILNLSLLDVEDFQGGFKDLLFDLQGNQILVRLDENGLYEIYQGPFRVRRR